MQENEAEILKSGHILETCLYLIYEAKLKLEQDRALEAPQLLLEYSGLEYEYLMSWDHFDDVWSK